MIKDLYFENPQVSILSVSVEFFKSDVITMTDLIRLIRSEFPERSFTTLLITVNGNPVIYNELKNNRIELKLEPSSEIIQIHALP